MNDRFAALRALLQDPAGNLAAVAAAVAIIVVFVVIVVLVLIAIALPSDKRRNAPAAGKAAEEDDQERFSLGVPGCLIGVVLAIAGLAGAAALWYNQTSTNAYCAGSCHSMAEAAHTWQSSAHSEIDCIRCHEGRKWQSFTTGFSQRTYEVYLQATGQRPRLANFDENTCRECHSGVLKAELTGRNGEPFRHTEVLVGGKQCADCHGAQGHVPRRAK